MTTLTNYKNEMKDIIRFAKLKGFDFENMNKESLDLLMNKWINNSKKFYDRVEEAPLSIMK
jgi:hypothetical protein